MSDLSANTLCLSKAKLPLNVNEVSKREPSCSLRLSKHDLGKNALDKMHAFCRDSLRVLDNDKKQLAPCIT